MDNLRKWLEKYADTLVTALQMEALIGSPWSNSDSTI